MCPSAQRMSALAATVAVILLVVPSSSGAVNVGSDLSRAPDIGFGSELSVTAPIATASGGSYAAPFDGVITRIRQRYGPTGPNPGSFAFRILTGANPYFARPATVDGFELRFPLPPNVAAGGTVDFVPVDPQGRPAGIPIAAGERVATAYERQPAGNAVDFLSTVAPGSAFHFVTGTQHLSGQLSYTNNGNPFELLLQAAIEPDADGDHLGDETQDQCPGAKNDPLTLRCPSLARDVPVVKEVTVARCKVPQLRGLTRAFASRLLVASGCRLGTVKTRAVRRKPAGRVIAQSTRANAELEVGARVGVTLSRSPKR